MRYIKLFSKDADYKSYMVGGGKVKFINPM